VLAVLVLEVVVDALGLHQPVDEVEIGLAILNAIVTRLILARELLLELRVRIFLEDLLDDVRHGLVLEDAAVGRARH